MWKEAKRSKLRRECRELVESFCCAEGDGTRHHIRRSASRLSSAGESGSLTIRKIGAFRRRRALTRCGWKEWGEGNREGGGTVAVVHASLRASVSRHGSLYCCKQGVGGRAGVRVPYMSSLNAAAIGPPASKYIAAASAEPPGGH